VYFEADDVDAAMSVLEPYVSPGVSKYLQAWSRLNTYQERVIEHKAIVAYRKKYTANSYNTADSLVRVGDYVLLIKRKSEFGDGLWALPGGFVNKNERFLTAAIRELTEETCFPIPSFTLLNQLQSHGLFDDPLRSPRAHLITNAFYFRFGEMSTLPEVHPKDDAREAKWFHIDELAAMEDQLFEDHFLILDHFLQIIQD
jgi:bifunctional NMN adenylyltransferase/nudix hydrolase